MRNRIASWGVLLGGALLALTACSETDPATALIVVADVETGLQLDAVQFNVTTPGNVTRESSGDPQNSPLYLTVEPAGGQLTGYVVEVVGQREDDEGKLQAVMSRAAKVDFAAGKIRVVELPLGHACDGVVCTCEQEPCEPQTCEPMAGSCTEAPKVTSYGTWTGTPPSGFGDGGTTGMDGGNNDGGNNTGTDGGNNDGGNNTGTDGGNNDGGTGPAPCDGRGSFCDGLDFVMCDDSDQETSRVACDAAGTCEANVCDDTDGCRVVNANDGMECGTGLACSAGTCAGTCTSSNSCTFNCEANDCDIDCADTKTCNASCDGSESCAISCAQLTMVQVDKCNANCTGGAQCVLTCGKSTVEDPCGFDTCQNEFNAEVAQKTCGDDNLVAVCNRECPVL